MNLQNYLDSQNITKYRLSKLSGVLKTTVIDICAGKSSLRKCSAYTVQQIAKALGCTMEYLMSLDDAKMSKDSKTGLAADKQSFECELTPQLKTSISNMIASWEKMDGGIKDEHWNLHWSELNEGINSAEAGHEITSEQAWHLRKMYLRMSEEESR